MKSIKGGKYRSYTHHNMISRRTQVIVPIYDFWSRFHTVTVTKNHKRALHFNRRDKDMRFVNNFSHNYSEKHISQHIHDESVYSSCHINQLRHKRQQTATGFVSFALYRLQNTVHIIWQNTIRHHNAR